MRRATVAPEHGSPDCGAQLGLEYRDVPKVLKIKLDVALAHIKLTDLWGVAVR
jgi:hypothetical protein